MGKKRRKFSAEDKVRILKRHLVDKVAISEVCDGAGISPTQFYKWQKQFFENGAAAFERRPAKKKSSNLLRVQSLEAKLRIKNEVISELLEDHVKLKKELGDL